MIHFLKLGRQAEVQDELKAARRSLAEAAFQRLEKEGGTEAEAIRTICKDHWTASTDANKTSPLDRRRHLTIAAVLAQRQRLEELRDTDQIGATQYLELQEDWTGSSFPSAPMKIAASQKARSDKAVVDANAIGHQRVCSPSAQHFQRGGTHYSISFSASSGPVSAVRGGTSVGRTRCVIGAPRSASRIANPLVIIASLSCRIMKTGKGRKEPKGS